MTNTARASSRGSKRHPRPLQPWRPGGAAYDAAVQALFSRRPDAAVSDADRQARMRAVCGMLGDPQHRFASVHVTGTNGKTTVTRMIAALLGSAGLRVGAYTSPHLQDVRERIHIDGRPISAADLFDRLNELAGVLDRVERAHGQRVTFFEALTALAFHHFATQQVDAAVVEVHSGGRGDTTNILPARIAVLGPVDLDHPRLGARVEQVAAEKAGIVKAGVGTVVSARQRPEAAAVIARAADRVEARLLVEGRDFAAGARVATGDGQQVNLAGLGVQLDAVRLPLHGAHQATNAAIALAAAESFLSGHDPAGLGCGGWASDERAVRAGFAAVRSPGRLEPVRRPGAAPVLLDGAHNPAAARALAHALCTDFPAFTQRVLVLGILGDKNVEAVLSALLETADALVVTQPPSDRAAPVDRVAKAARLAGWEPLVAPDVGRALATASALADPAHGVVVVTGSLYTVGAARDALGLRWSS